MKTLKAKYIRYLLAWSCTIAVTAKYSNVLERGLQGCKLRVATIRGLYFQLLVANCHIQATIIIWDVAANGVTKHDWGGGGGANNT